MGVLLENFISENRVILKWLRVIHRNQEVKEVLKVKLWVDKDFTNSKKIIENFIDSDKIFNNK